MTDRDRQIRDLAHRIWEEEGRPHGQDQRHWSEAVRRHAEMADGEKMKADGKAAKSSKLATPKAAGKSDKAPKTDAKPKAKAKAEAVSIKPGAAESPKPKAKKAKGKVADASASTKTAKAGGKAGAASKPPKA